MADPTDRKRLNFDPTINAGHILTFISMVVAVGVSYSLLDKRVGVLEERSNAAIIQAADKQAEQLQTQETIRSGDNAADAYVRQTRPLMARQSWQMTAIYVMTFSLLNAWGRGTGPDFDIVLMLMTPALAYLGLRTLDGWAPYSKASGDKVASAITALLPGKK